MATQTSFVTDMQTLNPVQQVQTTTQAQNNVQATSAPVKASSQGQTATIIQPAQAHSGQQFIVTITGDQANEQVPDAIQIQQGSGGGQVVYQPQYVEDSPDPAIYAGSNGQIQSYSDYNQGAMYSPVTGTYYQSNSSQMSGITQVGGIQGQILTHQGNTYVVQGGTMDGEGHPLTHTTRASPVTVQWLIDNYETAEGVSLPRSTLYNHYLRHCQEQKIDPMNPASFGKLIRSVFLGLRTRRLGTRGNSKYHYYGIRIKATSPLNQYTDEQTMAMRQQPVNKNRFSKLSQGSDGQEYADGSNNSAQHQHQQFLGDASCAIPDFGCIQMGNDSPPEGITFTDLAEFEELYKEHCEAILDIVVNLQFSLIEALWQSFWRNLDNTDPENSSDVDEHRLSKDKLYRLCRMPQVRNFVRKSDYAFYQALVEVLIPDVLRPIPSTLTQAIRNFAKSLEGWLKSSTEGIPDEMVKTKIGAVSAFAQTLRRYTSLNHLAQAARAVLQNTTQIGQMLTDLNRVDFNNVQEQASWVCQCDDEVVHQLEQDFKKTLQQQNSLEQWAEWLEGVVQQVLKPYEGKENFPKAARQFLLKWSFYSSMVIRDLTLRSAASFGSFHLIRLLYDEYMFYLVEHKVANVTGETPIAVMGEYLDLAPVMAMTSIDSDSKPTTATVTTATVVKQSPSMIKQVTPVINATMVKQVTQVANTAATMAIKQSTSVNAAPAMIKQTNSTAAIIKQATTMLNGQVPNQAATVPKSIVMAPASGSNLANLSNQIAASVHSQGQTGQVVSQVHAIQVTNPSTMSVVTSSGSQPKTIVVVPVSATTPGSGDAQPTIKKLKTTL